MTSYTLPNNIEAVLFDVDHTVNKKNTCRAVGERLIYEQLLRGKLVPLINGIKNYRRVDKIAKKNGVEGQVDAMRAFFVSLTENVDVTLRDFDDLTRRAILSNEALGFSGYNSALQSLGIGTYFSTASYDRIGSVSLGTYGIKGYAANQTLWKNSEGKTVKGNEITLKDSGEVSIDKRAILHGISNSIRTPQDKDRANAEMMRLAEIDEENVFYVGDNHFDHPSMERFGLAGASPGADKETVELVKKLGGVVIKDYISAKAMLKGFQTRKL